MSTLSGGVGEGLSHVHEAETGLLMAPLQQLLPGSRIDALAARQGHRWRCRVWTPALTILACIYKQIEAVASCRDIEHLVALLGITPPTRTRGTAFCQARKRIARSIFHAILSESANVCRLTFDNNHGQRFQRDGSIRLLRVDGTTHATPASECNIRTFGKPSNQFRDACLPKMRSVVAVCVESAAVVAVETGPYIGCSEHTLFVRLLAKVPENATIVADGLYSSYMLMAAAQRLGAGMIVANPVQRRVKARWRLGPGEWVERWSRAKHSMLDTLLPDAPNIMTIRTIDRVVNTKGWRSRRVRLATTLFTVDADELILAYAKRWQVEVELRHIKCTLRAARLTGQSPDIVEKELVSALIAYNLILAMMWSSGGNAQRMSVSEARHLIIKLSDFLTFARGPCVAQLLQRFAILLRATETPQRPRLPQPRAVVWRASQYPPLRHPRPGRHAA